MNNDFFNKNGYVIVKSAISQELRDFVTQYALFDEMQDFTPEKKLRGKEYSQVAEAHSKYGDPAMESLLLHMHPLMEANTGLRLYPTYSYYRVYRDGDDLQPHVDRPSCEISATICLNYNYDNKDCWPIYMDGSEVKLYPGDMVIYRGCDLKHWRNSFEVGTDVWQVQAFLHFVNADGPYSEFKFDRRESIGMVDRPNIQIGQDQPSHQKNYIIFTK